MSIYVTSDTHFAHDKEFLWGPRGFAHQWDMNDAIVSNWNNLITEEDDVYLLGDVMLSDTEEGMKCLEALKGKIHIIRGNHCTDARIELYRACHNVVEVCDAKYLKVGKQSFFLSHYPCLTSNFDADKPLNRRIINLCGHVHTQDRWLDWDKGLIYHVEMDAHNCTPVNIETVIEEIKNKLQGE